MASSRSQQNGYHRGISDGNNNNSNNQSTSSGTSNHFNQPSRDLHNAGNSAGSSEPKKLPKTIEGATTRYVRIYEQLFRGADEDRHRLRSYAEGKILNLRKKAPRFYEQRLPEIVNQAASQLLLIDTKSSAGLVKFNETHAQFLRVLDELKKTQPAGDKVNFQEELERTKKKDFLRKEHLRLRDKYDRMMATDFGNDELGEEEAELMYSKHFAELEAVKKEMKRVCQMIVIMEGEEKEDSLKFKLRVPPRTTLERLTPAQLTKLEGLFEKFYSENPTCHKEMLINKCHIDGIIQQLSICPTKFSPSDINQLTKEALDAYKLFFREIEIKRRESNHEEMLKNPTLRPKEGIIIEDYDDVPEEIEEKLKDSARRFKRSYDDTIDHFAKKPCNEDLGCDILEGEDILDSDDDDEAYIKDNEWLFARIKEEPRDDYEDDAPSEDEMLVDRNMAEGVEHTLGPTAIPEEDSENVEVPQSSPPQVTSSTSPSARNSPEQTSSEAQDQSPEHKPPIDITRTTVLPNSTSSQASGGFQMIGTVDPTRRVIDIITIDDD